MSKSIIIFGEGAGISQPVTLTRALGCHYRLNAKFNGKK